MILGTVVPKNFKRLSKINVTKQNERKQSIEEMLSGFFDSKKLYIKTAQNAKFLKAEKLNEYSIDNPSI